MMDAVKAKSSSGKRRVMVIADSGRESAGALQWALSHAILEQDELILLHVEHSSTRRSSSFSTFLKRPEGVGGGGGGGEPEFLEEMRTKCNATQPRVKVQVERVVAPEVEGSAGVGKANTILYQAKIRNIDLLVIGQPRRSLFSTKLSGSITMSSKGIDLAEHLIENSKCLCVGVQKKGQNAGYLLNTKTHKNFWLLA